ncbi:ATP-binding cassette domain-containing protein [Heliobacterium undosum]|uniref:ATP-binding cassette domain-containing protein n=1 Tax=Heliomicrobium undosum TaxID=121734 RepID=A0A845L091_9FIRM|nr:ATP-binding cassette domain-containing protein [Heliomicrobium undosum]
MDMRVGAYSKGMKQRLVFARSLLNRPDYLFLDEPTSGLDPATARIEPADPCLFCGRITAVVAYFAAAGWQWLFYPFPHYWIYRLLKALLVDGQTQFAGLFMVTLVMNALPLLLLLPMLKQRLRLR